MALGPVLPVLDDLADVLVTWIAVVLVNGTVELVVPTGSSGFNISEDPV